MVMSERISPRRRSRRLEIGYLSDNNLMAKAKRFLEDANGIMPF